jgi:protein tyrosine phosphatase (PTP) superfamily phosphohydrolase (DUF442 family)
MSTRGIYNYLKVDDAVITGGQPTEDHLRSAAKEGVRTVINLDALDSRNALADEASLVLSLGMAYHHIPVAWDDPLESDFNVFEDLLGGLPEDLTLIHCAANFRVTIFYSLYALKHLGWPEAQAEQFRSSIWRGRDLPVWNAFIRRIKAQIMHRRERPPAQEGS